MGVPGFFLWLMKKYRNEGFVFEKENLEIIDIDKYKKKHKDYTEEKITYLENKNNRIVELTNEISNIDWFLIDTNCLIHPVCFKVLAENPDFNDSESLETKMLDQVILYIEKIIEYVNPKCGAYIAIDGVAPVAKIKQQRTRRFKSVADRELFDSIKKKHDRPIHKFWNNSAITPGTKFMEKLHNRILSWAEKYKYPIIYSSCLTPAEGEHKLLQFVRSNQNSNNILSYVIYGLDADLIFLALASQSNKIFLLRESNEIKKDSSEILSYVDIKKMRECVVDTIKKYIVKAYSIMDLVPNNESLEDKLIMAIDSNRVVNDFIFICYLLGNDFLPHIPSLDIYDDGLNILLDSYGQTIYENQIESKMNYILDNKNINQEFLKIMIQKISVQEELILKEHFSIKRKMSCDGDEYEREVFRIENMMFKFKDPIKLGSDDYESWRKRYYKHYYNVNENELEKFVEQLVKNYLIGIKWVSEYYFDKCASWTWYLPYDHPPFITDIYKYIDKVDLNQYKFELNSSAEAEPLARVSLAKLNQGPLKPYMQLLSVLPPQSSYLLPNCFAKLMNNYNSSIGYMYPLKFDQDFINKRKYWMCIPKLPPLDIESVRHSYHKYKNELSKDEIKRNESVGIYKFNI